MNSSPRQERESDSSVKLFEYLESGALRLNPAPTKTNGKDVDGSGGSQDLQRLLAEARALGVHEGLQQAQQNAASSQTQELVRVADAIRVFQQQAADYYSRVEVELVHLALAIAAKILHREAQVDRMLVGALAKVALEKLQNGTKVVVHVNPDESAAWNHYLQTNLAGRMNVEVKGDTSVEAHNCLLETELGETEIGLDAQLKEIERGFFDLLAQRPETK